MFQAPVFVLELPQPLGLADLHTAVLPFPRVQRGGAHAQLPRHIGGLASALHLLYRHDDLLFRVPAFLHLEFSFSKLENSSLEWQSFRGAGQVLKGKFLLEGLNNIDKCLAIVCIVGMVASQVNVDASSAELTIQIS